MASVPIHSYRLFNWKSGNGVAEISDLPRPVTGRLFDDACDVGLVVIGKDGLDHPFYLVSTDKDGSGEDIYGWHFKGVEPKYKDVEILIIND